MITLRCIVDNTAARGSSFWGEHGVAFSIETPAGSLLFDTGQSGEVLAHNAGLLGIDLARCNALALSHAHDDHTGGLERFVGLSRPGIPLYASPDIFRERYSLKGGQECAIGLRLPQAAIERHAQLRLSAEPQEIFPGVWTSGEIRERPHFEGRVTRHYIRASDAWQPDPYQDDLSLVLQTSQGLVLVCGCCHAGLLNVLDHIQRCFSQPMQAIVGGTHLVSAAPEDLDKVIAKLDAGRSGNVPDLYLNHCAGDRALTILAQAFSEKVHPCPAGTALAFE